MWFYNLLLSCAGIKENEEEIRLKKKGSDYYFSILWYDDNSFDMVTEIRVVSKSNL